MKALDFQEAMGQMDDKIILEVTSAMINKQDKAYRKGRKVLRTLLIAAVIATLLTAAVYATGALINSPAQAIKIAQQEVEQLKSIDLLSAEVVLDGVPLSVGEQPAMAGDEYWFGRIWQHRYDLIGFSSDKKYSYCLNVDTASGKLTYLSIEAEADETDTPDPGSEIDLGGTTYYLYRNFDDIFPADMTIDSFCTLLAQYWGFSGYTLSGTEDDRYGYDTNPPSGDTLLTELVGLPYLTVYFDGDQSGVPMYIKLAQFPGRVCLMVGTGHAVG